MKFSSVLIAAVFAAITIGVWGYLNRPTMEPRWPEKIQGVAFSPFYAGQDPMYRKLPTDAQIDADLQLLSGKVTSVRTYSSLLSLGRVPQLAAKHRLKVTVGAWLDRQLSTNNLEVMAAIRLANAHSNVIRLVIGNESILRGDLDADQVAEQLDRVRAAVTQPVSTAEPWHVWISHPELASHVDFITVHLLPYWEGIPVEQGLNYVASRVALLQRTFPGKEIVIGEVGWPSDGRTREAAVASTSNEALFLRRFLRLAASEGYIYYLMEAFDQPWKAKYEGAVGAYWGIYNVDREPKFAFIEPIVRIPQWQTLAGISVVLAMMLIALFFTHSRALGTRGRSLLAIVAYAAAAALVWIVYDYSQQYLTLFSALLGCLLLIGMLGVIAIMLAEAHEWAEARFAKLRRRSVDPATTSSLATPPRVSIHVPASNEPPQMLIETLDALARLDYEDYEVIVVDNNTTDDSLWKPVKTHCQQLGERFRFFRVAHLAGFKAGALNFALEHTDSSASIVAVIDSDYQVHSHWLRDLLPLFDQPAIAIVQAPQDYRDEAQNAFKAMCFAEYRGFFYIGMVTRNERNAIIQHGTMTLVRHAALREVSGWAEWSITEDAELGLRLFEHGYEAQYVARSYGRGLMPDGFRDYKKQRFRWAYGAVQILRRHRRMVFSRDPRLTAGQRYHFIAGWLPWLADGVNLLFNVAAVCWSTAMIVAPHRVDPPLIMFSVLPLSLFAFRLVKLAHLYTSRVGANFRQTAAAAIAGLALSHTIGLAVIKSVFTQREPFRRTPKHSHPRGLGEGFAAAGQELTFLVCMWTLAWVLTHRIVSPLLNLGIPEELKGPDLSVWVAVMLIQSVPYCAALLLSFVSVMQLPASLLGKSMAPPVPEHTVTPKRA